ncbi:MAG: ribonuclease HII [Chloroflexi bacterium]|nr:ribonuclease HII [Chloroflexota bacterium]
MRAKFDLSLVPPAPDLRFEQALWASGLQRVGGVDEAGRGAWAGPVAAAVVILPDEPDLRARLNGVRDSKQMTPAEREKWAQEIRLIALAWGVGFASNLEIDAAGILAATRLAAGRALAQAASLPEHLLIDYLALPEVSLPQTPLIKGDARSLSIAAASVLAKTARDALLCEMDQTYPGYGFARHKGYGTAAHSQALQLLGPTPAHRMSFAPLIELVGHIPTG